MQAVNHMTVLLHCNRDMGFTQAFLSFQGCSSESKPISSLNSKNLHVYYDENFTLIYELFMGLHFVLTYFQVLYQYMIFTTKNSVYHDTMTVESSDKGIRHLVK
jgi:hypothetical protein